MMKCSLEDPHGTHLVNVGVLMLQLLMVLQEHRSFLAQSVYGACIFRHPGLQIPGLLFNSRRGYMPVS